MQRVWSIKKHKATGLIEALLENRGILGDKEKTDFLNVDYGKLHSPFLFGQMEKAAKRIWEAVENKEKILIYGDYDADAVTASAVLMRMFESLGIKPQFYIPDRFTEGYGLNLGAFRQFKEQGVNLIITVDCGTNSVGEAEFCAANGIDIIITDHHEITGDLPGAYALINPKNPSDKYPYHELTGVGVAFKLACAVLSDSSKHNLPEGYEKWLLDLVAIGTVADCHSLMGENRILVKYGLQVMAKTKWIGLKALLEIAGYGGKTLDTYTLGFIIAPRINAAGRLEHAGIALEMLLANDLRDAMELARRLEQLNSKRQMLTETVMSEAREQLTLIAERKILLASGSNWPKGVVGLVAGKLTEEFNRPVLVLERGDEESTGSARSVNGFNIVEALNFSKSVLVKYGGHAQAAGFTLRTEHIEIFYKKLLDFADEKMNDREAEKIIEIDAEARGDDLNMRNFEIIEMFQPFGVENPAPRFMASGAEVRQAAAVGKDGKHLQLTVAVPGNEGVRIMKCIGFGFGRAAQTLTQGKKIDIVFELIADLWNGRKELKLRIIDFREAQQRV